MTKETGIGIGIVRENGLEGMNGKCHDCDKILNDSEMKASEAQGTLKNSYCSICIKKEDWTEEEFANYEQDCLSTLKSVINLTLLSMNSKPFYLGSVIFNFVNY